MRLKSLLLWVFCLSWVISCSCGSIPPEVGESHFSAQIYTDKLECLGSINIKGILLKVEGRIQDNQLKGESKLCLLIIPEGVDGVTVQTAAQELSELNQEPSEQGASIELVKSKGFAYYGSSIAASYFGGLTHTAYVANLDSTKQYKAYLGATSQGSAQWVVYSEKGIDIKFSWTNATASQVVEMVAANAERDATKVPSPMKFKWEGQVSNKEAGFDGGFLLIKQGSSIKQPGEVLASLIQQNKALPQGKVLEKVAGYEGVLVSTVVTPVDFKSKHFKTKHFKAKHGAANENIASEGEDMVKDLEPGATYQVYCYIVDGGHNYIISKEELVSIPKVNAELEMLAVSNAHLVGNMTTEVVNNFKLNLKGKILKQEGTIKPDFGFLFVKGAAIDQVAAIKKVTDLSAHTIVGNFNKNAGDIIYVADQPGPAAAGESGGELEFKDVEDALKDFELGQEYTVYCWLKDGGDVFVSVNSVELKIPKAVGRPDNVAKSQNEIEQEIAFITSISSIIDSQIYFDKSEQTVWGFLFVKNGTAVALGDFENLLKHAQDLEKRQKEAIKAKAQGVETKVPGDNLNNPTELSSPDKIFIRTNLYVHQPKYPLVLRSHAPFEEESDYQVYFWVRNGNTLFYSNAANQPLETLEDIIKEKQSPQIVGAVGMNADYQHYHIYLKGKQRVYGIKAGDEKVLLNKTADEILLRAILDKMIRKPQPTKKQEIDNIITNLNLI